MCDVVDHDCAVGTSQCVSKQRTKSVLSYTLFVVGRDRRGCGRYRGDWKICWTTSDETTTILLWWSPRMEWVTATLQSTINTESTTTATTSTTSSKVRDVTPYFTSFSMHACTHLFQPTWLTDATLLATQLGRCLITSSGIPDMTRNSDSISLVGGITRCTCGSWHIILPFGLISQDFSDPARPRTAKSSAIAYKQLILDNGFPEPDGDRAGNNFSSMFCIVIALFVAMLFK